MLPSCFSLFTITKNSAWSLSQTGSTFDSVVGTCCISIHKKFYVILATFYPEMCPMKFNKLNFVQHVEGQNIPQSKKSISIHEGRCHCNISLGHVPAAFPCTCANIVIFVPVTHLCNMLPQCPPHKVFHVAGTCCYLSLQHVPATCPCNMSLQHIPVTCPCNMSLQHVHATCPCNMSL